MRVACPACDVDPRAGAHDAVAEATDPFVGWGQVTFAAPGFAVRQAARPCASREATILQIPNCTRCYPFLTDAFVSFCVWQALCDAPDMKRTPMYFKRLAITEFKVDIEKTPKKPELVAAIKDSGVFESFAKSAWGKKLAARAAKAATSDFDRFKKMVAKKAKAAKTGAAFKKLKA